jgi:putative pyruvate formate lyase activating enzyme
MEQPTRRQFLEASLASAASPQNLPTLRRKDFEPACVRLERAGELANRASKLYSIYQNCHLCPRNCGVNRTKGEKGVCSSISRAKVSSARPHFGEERPLVGRGGSGAIFFSNCNLLCAFCQNWEINHRGDGSFTTDEVVGRLMTDLQEAGCHNINVVTPTHILPNIVGALRSAIRRGLRVPLVYNCGGYESVEIIKLLDGIVDIYLPDFKYADGAMAEKYSSGARDYPERAAAAILEMHRQVGDLLVDENGIALRGLMIRHLVLPGNIAGTDRFVQFVATSLSRSTYVNIMAQYRPEYKARGIPELSRRITGEEYRQAVRWAKDAGLTRLDPG